MARCCGRATSRFNGKMQRQAGNMMMFAVFMCLCLFYLAESEAGLYSATDQIILLTPEIAESVLVNSTAAIVVEFYASWCGHCIAFSPVYKQLARDIKEWKPAVDLAAMDCAEERNRKVCTEYSIRGYPTLKFFNAYSNPNSKGQPLRASSRDVRGLRQAIIDGLDKHEEPWPPACPPLEPTSEAELNSFFDTNNVQHLALIFENSKSFIGREVTLDLLQYENVAVRRVLNTEEALVSKLGVTDFPSCYLYYPGGNFTRVEVKFEARAFYSYALQRLPGVVRTGKPIPNKILQTNDTNEPWRPFNASRVYMADLESTLHYSLRVEVSAFPVINGGALKSLKKYISVLAKYFPGRQIVMNLLKSVDTWLQNLSASEISYDAFRALLDNTVQSSDTALPDGVRWVGCQGSQPHFRRYPCGFWTLFHVLTVQAMNSRASDGREVLSAMRDYVRVFFGCRACAEHFESMARESLAEVPSASTAVVWLWSRHNRVNNRLAGALSEDPYFPKIQWPSPEMCSLCHTVKVSGDHKWDLDQVLTFLTSYFSTTSILTDYLDDESAVLEKQKEKLALEAKKRIEREVKDATTVFPMSSILTEQGEEEEEEAEEEEGPQDEAVEEDLEGKNYDTTPWAKPDLGLGERRQRRAHNRPVIVGMRMRQQPEDIVDLDSFVNQHYRAKALAAASRVKPRTLQRKEEQDPPPAFGLGLGLDTGLGMVGLEPVEPDFERQKRKRVQKRELSHKIFNVKAEESHRKGWVTVFNLGFSKVDISLCIILYFLSSMCLLAMYLFFKTRLRIRRFKVSLP